MNLQMFSLSVLSGKKGTSEDRDEEWLRAFRHFDPRLRDYFGKRNFEIDLDELVGDIWGRACLFISTLNDAAALWTWLTTIGNNIVLDRARTSKRRPTASLDSMKDAVAIEESFVKAWIATDSENDLRTRVDEMLSQLSPDEREFLKLVVVDGFSHEVIARQLGLPSAAASRQRLRRLRLRLQSLRSEDREWLSVLPRKEVKG